MTVNATDNQREMPLVSPVNPPCFLPWEYVESCEDELEALLLTWNMRRVRSTERDMCATLGVDAGHWTRIKQGAAHFPLNKRNAFMDYCGNHGLLQYDLIRRQLDQPFRYAQVMTA